MATAIDSPHAALADHLIIVIEAFWQQVLGKGE
jgi:hypothetical protein